MSAYRLWLSAIRSVATNGRMYFFCCSALIAHSRSLTAFFRIWDFIGSYYLVLGALFQISDFCLRTLFGSCYLVLFLIF